MKNNSIPKIICLSLLCLNASLASAQKQTAILAPSSFFPATRAKVLFVGSFHFHYPGFDPHVTSATDKVDVLSETKKRK
jgi:hypothetical protein